MSSSAFLDQYEPLDIIGNGSFGIIRKVRRKTDGVIFARKELNFERMSERDRKQIVSEVNILKDLHHEHIVRYHDRYVDRDAGILYILMEYCGGGDLSTIIKQATKQNRPLPEDTIWNYFLQILLALHHCHHPNAHAGTGSTNLTGPLDGDANSRRTQILHRDLKPDNVFLDSNNTVKLGDFGLSKALAQASFANTYVGTPYYMSPELMQEKAYDSKSDIWSLGCLIYELCALKPPFHEAKTHAELSIFIRNGRIPPLPRGYSQALTSVIKSMLNLNPAMRPSAAQLLQHERLEFIFNVAETEKMLSMVKGHRSTLANKEREIVSREQAIVEKEQHLASLLGHKDHEIASLHQLVGQLQQSLQASQQEQEMSIKQAIVRREEELRVLICKREEEVALAMAQREEEIMEAVRNREEQVSHAWARREAEIRQEVGESLKSVEERVQWRENELMAEEIRLNEVREELEEKMRKIDEDSMKVRKGKHPLEEVKNRLEPLDRMTQETPTQRLRRKGASQPTPKPVSTIRIPSLETPVSRPAYVDTIPSAMKGVVLTSTGETLATPSQAELVNLFNCSPKVGLNFAKIFDFEGGNREGMPAREPPDDGDSPPPSPSSRKTKEKEQKKERDEPSESSSSSSGSSGLSTTITPQIAPAAPPTRIRRPSIRTSTTRPTHSRAGTLPTSTSESIIPVNTPSSSSQPKPLPHPHLRPSKSSSNLASNPGTIVRAATMPAGPILQGHPRTAPEYDLDDEENLPSPFLKKHEKNIFQAKTAVAIGSMMNLTTVVSVASTSTSTSTTSTASRGKRRPSSGGILLRAVAAANNVGRRGTISPTSTTVSPVLDNGDPDSQIESTPFVNTDVTPDNHDGGGIPRPSLASARKASEEARKALLRA